MIRSTFIRNHVLRLYQDMDSVVFPVEPCTIFSSLDNCRALTYQKFAEMNGCDIDTVIRLCQSKTGCTHYDVEHDRYLVLWNEKEDGRKVPGRIRWTKAHELGHVILRHPLTTSIQKFAEGGFGDLSVSDCEAEADYFASTLLCPLPLFEKLRIKSPTDIMYVFGLSVEASNYRWEEYQRWLKRHVKTAWENDFRNVIQQKIKDGKFSCSTLRAENTQWFHGGISIWKDSGDENSIYLC